MIDWMKSLCLFSDNLGNNIGERFNNLFYKKLFDFDKRLLIINNQENKAKLIFEKNIMINNFFGYASEIEYYSTFNLLDIKCILDYFGVDYEGSDDVIVFYAFYCYIADDAADIKIVENSVMENNYALKAFIDFVIKKRIINKIDYVSSFLINKFLEDFKSKDINSDGINSSLRVK